MNRTITLVVVKAGLGAGLALGFLAALHGTAHADTVGHYDAYAAEVGDDNADGIITEDDSGFDCRVMSNLRCGPGALLPDGSLAIPGDYSNPNCWPGAIYCPPAGTRADATVTDRNGVPVGPLAYHVGAYVGGYN